MLQSILVPLDGSPFAEQALPLAAALANRSGADLHLVRVHLPLPVPDVPWSPQFEDVLREEERDYLTLTADRVWRESGCRVSSWLEDGIAEAAIRRRAAESGAGVIVMTTHGRTGMSRMWFGSVADAIVSISHLPVLLVRPEETPRAPKVPPFRSVLVLLDGSEAAEQILTPALELAKLVGAPVTLLQVVVPVAKPAFALTAGGDEIDGDAQRAAVEAGEIYVRGAAELARRLVPGVEVKTDVQVSEHAATGILDLLDAGRFDLVAMTTHGRGMRRVVRGSVADKLLRGATQPMLVLRPLLD